MPTPTRLPLDGQGGAIRPEHIYTVLGVARRNNGYELNYICSNAHGKTRKWAKYKPEAVGGPAPISLTTRMENNFGLIPAEVYNGITNFRTAVANNTFNGKWSYVAPGASNYMRISDWLRLDTNTVGKLVATGGYNHEAKTPFGTLHEQTLMLHNSTQWRLLIPCEAPPQMAGLGDDDGLINIADFQKVDYNLCDWYFGVLLYYNSNKYRIATTLQPIGTEQDWQVDMGYLDPNAYAGTPKAVPFLSSVRIPADRTADPSGVRIVGIDSQGVTLTLQRTDQAYTPEVNCQWTDRTHSKIRYRVKISNTTATTITVQNVYLRLATSATGANEEAVGPLTVRNDALGNGKIAGNSYWTEEAIINNPNINMQYEFCRLSFFVAGSIVQSGWINFEDIEQSENPDLADWT